MNATAPAACMTDKEWKEARPIVEGFFEEGWKHKRIDAELTNAAQTISRRSAAGKAGAEAMHSKRTGNRMANAEQPHANGAATALRPHKQTHAQPQPPTQPPKKEAAQPVARGREELDRIENGCREAAGLTESASPGLLDLSPILTLLDQGYSLETDILPVLRAKAGQGKTPGSWRYFVPAISEAKTSNSRTKPKGADPPPDKWAGIL
jgi:uncharacterized protein YdaU (DUF1376 family)